MCLKDFSFSLYFFYDSRKVTWLKNISCICACVYMYRYVLCLSSIYFSFKFYFFPGLRITLANKDLIFCHIQFICCFDWKTISEISSWHHHLFICKSWNTNEILEKIYSVALSVPGNYIFFWPDLSKNLFIHFSCHLIGAISLLKSSNIFCFSVLYK
jgi:hypothetical protein